MKKISTLYKKDPNDLSQVINELNSENFWVFECGIPTRKFDGTACMIKDGKLWVRYDAKAGRDTPIGGIPCQEKDPITGHQPFWIKPDANSHKWQIQAFETSTKLEDGTYECCGPHFQKNPEHFPCDCLIKHGCEILDCSDFSFEGLKQYLSNPELDIEGIVFHASDGSGRMCKIRKCDFRIKRGIK